MITKHDLSQLDWNLSGWMPNMWRMQSSLELGESPAAEIPAIPAPVPGSVQFALRDAGILPDWNEGLNYRECEWVENRHWVYETTLPTGWFEPGLTCRLNCLGLDHSGCVVLNGQIVGEFRGSYTPHVFDLTPHLSADGPNVLRVIFELPPRWLGMCGWSDKFTDWKPRFNYTWDWTVRVVQLGIWGSITIEATDGREITDFRCTSDADPVTRDGTLTVRGAVPVDAGQTVRISLSRDGNTIRSAEMPADLFAASGVHWDRLPVELWWCNLNGDQPLYDLECGLYDVDGTELHKVTRRVGFRHIGWRKCEGSPEGSPPWICEINGRTIFLQGVNWTPILPNFADVTEDEYRKRLRLYKNLGANLLRVWGGAVLERECFYNLCDELGLMVWQEFPLSSSGLGNSAPTDDVAIAEMAGIARSYVLRRQHHASLILWCGGNELLDDRWVPNDLSHPMLSRLRDVVADLDPTRRFVPASAGGPSFCADAANFGKGVHWDVHGPWKLWSDMESWREYWQNDDALFRSETGCPSASPIHIIRQSLGGYDEMPIHTKNPLWRRPTTWWTETEPFVADQGREPETLEEYIAWTQARQSEALGIAAKSCRDRFPRCGGILIWMGHDCFPCTVNTSIIDLDGAPKPAALALKEIWRTPVGGDGS